MKQNNVNDFHSHVLYESFLKHVDQHDPPCAAIFCLCDKEDEIILCNLLQCDDCNLWVYLKFEKNSEYTLVAPI